MTDIFMEATRQGLTYATPKGLLTTDQLWTLPVSGRSTQLDLEHVAQKISDELEAQSKTSFFSSKANPARAKLELALEVVKFIGAYKLKEAEDAKNAAVQRELRAAKRLKIINALENQETQELSGKSREDLLKELAETDD